MDMCLAATLLQQSLRHFRHHFYRTIVSIVFSKSGVGRGLALRYRFSRFTFYVAIKAIPYRRECALLSKYTVSARTTTVAREGCYPLPCSRHHFYRTTVQNYSVKVVAGSVRTFLTSNQNHKSGWFRTRIHPA